MPPATKAFHKHPSTESPCSGTGGPIPTWSPRGLQPQTGKAQECPEKPRGAGGSAGGSPPLSGLRVLSDILVACPVEGDSAAPSSQSRGHGQAGAMGRLTSDVGHCLEPRRTLSVDSGQRHRLWDVTETEGEATVSLSLSRPDPSRADPISTGTRPQGRISACSPNPHPSKPSRAKGKTRLVRPQGWILLSLWRLKNESYHISSSPKGQKESRRPETISAPQP